MENPPDRYAPRLDIECNNDVLADGGSSAAVVLHRLLPFYNESWSGKNVMTPLTLSLSGTAGDQIKTYNWSSVTVSADDQYEAVDAESYTDTLCATNGHEYLCP